MTKPDRTALHVAAGAALGGVTGYALGKPLFGILIWALIGAVVVGGAFFVSALFGSEPPWSIEELEACFVMRNSAGR